MVSTYPERAKSLNLRRDPAASMVVMSDNFRGEWVQVDGTAVVIDIPDSVDGLVEYFRVISGEHRIGTSTARQWRTRARAHPSHHRTMETDRQRRLPGPLGRGLISMRGGDMIRIGGWFQGPTGSGHGGWTAHRFTERIGRPVSTALRAPIPLETDLILVDGDDHWSLIDDSGSDPVTIMVARAWEPSFADTEPVSVADAKAARARFVRLRRRPSGSVLLLVRRATRLDAGPRRTARRRTLRHRLASARLAVSSRALSTPACSGQRSIARQRGTSPTRVRNGHPLPHSSRSRSSDRSNPTPRTRW